MRICLILLFSLQQLSVFSQDKDPDHHYSIGAQALYGFIIPHAAAVEPVSHTNPYGIEFSINKLKTSYDSWRVFHFYNISGFQAGFYNFQNPCVVGNVLALSVFTEPVISRGKRHVISVRAGAGFSYQTKIYDPESDSTNKFFSTRISFPLYLSARFKYRITPKTYLTLSGTYNHISNGAIRIPNYGINFPTVSIGLEYLQSPMPDFNHGYMPDKNRKRRESYVVFQVLTGYKVVYDIPTLTYGISTRYTRQFRSWYSLNAGAEMIFDNGNKKVIEIKQSGIDYKRFALTGGHDFLLGKVSFTQYLGVYLYSPYKAKHPVYQKYELSCKVYDNLLAGIFLKTHTSDAELFGFTLNYILRLKTGGFKRT